MKITKDTRPVDIEELKPYIDRLMYKVVPIDKPAVEMTFAEMAKEQPTWNVSSMIRGAEHLREKATEGNLFYQTYSEADISEDSEKGDVGVFFLPADTQPSNKPFIICCSGGAYSCVCSLVESFPTAVYYNEMGYNVFVINYRVGDGSNSLLPKPLEDMASAVRYILDHREDFGIYNTNYIVNGFSAGASLTSIWGTKQKGYEKYSLPRPIALIPIYPAISTAIEYVPAGPGRDFFLSMMFGQCTGEKEKYENFAAGFNVPELLDGDYPPCYIAVAEDDPVVNPYNSFSLKELLEKNNIPVRLEVGAFGGHGWGDGSGSGAAGWPYRAIHFLENMK